MPFEENYEYLIQVLEQSRQKLLDTTRRNRLLAYKEAVRDIAVIDEMADIVFGDLVENGRSFYFDPSEEEEEGQSTKDLSPQSSTDRTLPESRLESTALDARYGDDRLQTPFSEKELERRLRRLYQEHRTLIEETGANSLFLAMGFLEWYLREDEEKPVRSPLVLLPIKLNREGSAGQAKYSVSFDESALDSNYSLIEKLRKDYDINLPQIEEEEKPESYWQKVEVAIPRRHRENWRVAREMSIGLFRFSKQVMWHDLNPDRWPQHAPLVDKKVVKRILIGASEGEQAPGQVSGEYAQDGDNVHPEADKIQLILDADSSQYSALVDSLTCESGLVIEGPPGTGKSQTITNLIASALDQGLSVLFVAEKMAALEVVHNRLTERGLAPFCMELHGLKTSKKDLLESIVSRIDYQLGRVDELSQKERQLRQAREDLINFSIAMSQKAGPEDLPLYDMAWRVEKLRQGLPNEIDEISLDLPLDISYEGFITTRNKLDDLGKQWSEIPLEARDAWKGFIPTRFKDRHHNKFSKYLKDTQEAIKPLERFLTATGAETAAPVLEDAYRILKLSDANPGDLLPNLPSGASSSVIRNIARSDMLKEYDSLLSDIKKYFEVVGRINKTFDYSSDEATNYAKLLYRHSERLSGVALTPDTELSELAEERSNLSSTIESLQSLHSAADYVLRLLSTVARTIEDFENLANRSRMLYEGPSDLILFADPNHAKKSIQQYLKQAKDVAREIADKFGEFPQFSAEKEFPSDELEQAANILELNIGSWLSIFKSDYRTAKKLAKKALKDPSEFRKDSEFITSMKGFTRASEAREEFAAEKTYKATLGTLFKGMATDWKKLDQLINFSQSLRETIGMEKAQAVLSNWEEHIEKSSSACDELESKIAKTKLYRDSHPFPESLWQRPVNEIVNTLNPWIEKIWSANSELNSDWCNSSTTLENAKKAAQLYSSARKREQAIGSSKTCSELLSSHWLKAETNVDNLVAIESWFAAAHSNPGMHNSIIAWLFDDNLDLDRDKFEKLHNLASNFAKQWQSLIDFLQTQGHVNKGFWPEKKYSGIGNISDRLENCTANLTSLSLLKRWGETSEVFHGTRLSEIPKLLLEGEIGEAVCGRVYEYSIYYSILRSKINSDSRLADFSHSHHQGTRNRFANLDREIKEIHAKQIAARLVAATVPEGVGTGPVANYSQKRLLVHEANKQRRHIPIRQLVKRSGDAIKALKPCFLMSPLSVAQYLGPGDIHFDLVVMDEASQIRPEDALGAIARADRAIIVGDPKQLPPTNFFDSGSQSEDEESEATILDDTEAILDVCLKQFPYRRLRWHYRSEHESLIQFSNDQFYDGDLIVFPSPKPDSRDFGVHYNFIDSPNYSRGKNRNEAEVIVDNIIRHYHRHNKLSLGVAAFNKTQAEEIRLLLEKAREKDPIVDRVILEHDGADPLFIKNLENVQGDERDVIFISTTYGPQEPGGPVAQRFGPINSDSGWRRLNVIATRAKKRVEVFSSMRPTDVGRGGQARRGVLALRDYLDFASSGRIPEHGRRTHKDPDSDFEIAVINVIERLGFQCDPQVGVAGFYIDIGVINPDRTGEYLIGIECDGAAYHSSQSVRDRDRLRQEILESKGWELHRIWSTNWFHSRFAEIDRLKRVLQQKLDQDRETNAALDDFKVEEEIVSDSYQPDEHELQKELLEETLERFWQQNIRPLYPDRSRSILSQEMIKVLVKEQPTNPDEWFKSIPIEMRQKIDPDEGEFRQDVFEIITEYF